MLAYDQLTGELRWRATMKRAKAGAIAGKMSADGYRRIGIGGRLYPASHLAWLIVTGAWSETQIDHRNTNRADNSWVNLRQATQSQNVANANLRSSNTSGFKGVSLQKDTGRWAAHIKRDGKTRYLGAYATKEEAAAVYENAATSLFGDFARFR